MMGKVLRFGLRQLKILKKVKSLHVTMDLDLNMTVTNNSLVNVNLKTVAAIS